MIGKHASWWDTVKDVGVDTLGAVDSATGTDMTGSLLEDQASNITSDTIKGQLGSTMGNMFSSPDKTKEITKGLVSGEPLNSTSNSANPKVNEFSNSAGKAIGESLRTAVQKSDKLSLPTSIGVGGFNMGTASNMLSRLGSGIGSLFGGSETSDKPKQKGLNDDIWAPNVDDMDKSSKQASRIKRLADEVSNPFKPDTPAITAAADGIAPLVEEGAQDAVKNTLNNYGQAGFQALSGNFGDAFGLVTGNNSNMNVQGE